MLSRPGGDLPLGMAVLTMMPIQPMKARTKPNIWRPPLAILPQRCHKVQAQLDQKREREREMDGAGEGARSKPGRFFKVERLRWLRRVSFFFGCPLSFVIQKFLRSARLGSELGVKLPTSALPFKQTKFPVPLVVSLGHLTESPLLSQHIWDVLRLAFGNAACSLPGHRVKEKFKSAIGITFSRMKQEETRVPGEEVGLLHSTRHLQSAIVQPLGKGFKSRLVQSGAVWVCLYHEGGAAVQDRFFLRLNLG
ncbi:hypothetical protein E2320_009333 [Naja naja]|nr:hypothetical protein E2320_009333 [Naja naja]